jgi:hypothetical protein
MLSSDHTGPPSGEISGPEKYSMFFFGKRKVLVKFAGSFRFTWHGTVKWLSGREKPRAG